MKHKETSLIKKLLQVICNPMVLLPTLGIILNDSNVVMPEAILSVVRIFSTSATGFALFTFGLSLGCVTLDRELLGRKVLILTFIKNILHPLFSFIVGKYVFALHDYLLYSLVIAGTAPTAFIVHFLAKQYDVSVELIKRVVALSAIVSLVSLIAVVYALGTG